MTDRLDAVVSDYLGRLDQAAASLPPERRAELVGEIAEHIAHARAAGSPEGEAGLRELLDRIGDPEEIVAAAREDDPTDPPGPPGPPPPVAPPWGYQPPVYRQQGIGLEIAAIVLMTVGSIIPFLAWLLGTVLLWSSHRLRVGEKLLMTLVVPGGPLLVIPFLTLWGGQVCTSSSSATSAGGSAVPTTVCSGFAFDPRLGVPLLIVTLVAPFVIGGLLLKKAAERAKLEPPVLARGSAGSQGRSPWGPLEIAAVLLLAIGWLVIPIFGPIAGLVCAWISPAWTTSEKWIATAILFSIAALVALALIAV